MLVCPYPLTFMELLDEQHWTFAKARDVYNDLRLLLIQYFDAESDDPSDSLESVNLPAV